MYIINIYDIYLSIRYSFRIFRKLMYKIKEFHAEPQLLDSPNNCQKRLAFDICQVMYLFKIRMHFF